MRHFILTVFDVDGADLLISKIKAAQDHAWPQILEYREVPQQTIDYIDDLLKLMVEAKRT